MKIQRPTKASLMVLVLLAASFLAFAIQPAEAASPIVQNSQSSSFATQVSMPAVVVNAKGDLIVLGTNVNFRNTSDGTFPPVIGINTITDSCGDGWTQANGAQSIVTVGTSSPIQILSSAVTLWYAVATCSGVVTLTITLSQTPSWSNFGESLFDVSNAVPLPTGALLNCISCPSPYSTGSSTTFGAGAISFGAIGGVNIGAVTNGFNYVLLGMVQYSVLATSPTNYPWSGSNPASSLALEAAATFAPTTVISTTTINAGCLGACSDGNNGTGNYLIRNQLYFYESQNQLSTGQVTNVTLKVAAVHMNVTSGILYVTTYSSPTPPNGGNHLTLIQSTAVPIANGTSNFFIHVNPQANLCSGCYYAVGVMAAPEGHSRGSGAANSGISVYETSQVGITEYVFAPVGPSGTAQTPPTNFFSLTPKGQHQDFMFIQTIFTVGIITTTSTVMLSGIVTSTVLVTSTSTQVVNQPDPTKPTFWYIPMFYILMFVAIFMGILMALEAVRRGRNR